MTQTKPGDVRMRIAMVASSVGVAIAVLGIVLRARSDSETIGHAISALGFVINAGGQAGTALLTRSVSHAINVPFSLCVAFAQAAGRSDEFAPPAWLTGSAIAILVLLIGGAIPLAVHIVRQQQDERERKILMNAMSIAFTLTMVVVLTFVLLEEYTDVDPPSISWVLVAAAASWFGSYFVLRERM